MTLTSDVLLVHLRVAGVLMALLVLVNFYVPRELHWREELARVSLVNRQIFQVHTLFIVVTLALLSALLLSCADALLQPSRLSRAVLTGLTVFWGVRLVVQWGVYSPEIWRGHRLYTVVHYVFSAAWIYLTATCAAALWLNLSIG